MSESVLIVGTGPGLGSSLARLCASKGMKVILASRNFEKLKDKKFDVVLMDMQMPIMGGIEATVIIREELKLSIPIIALTARAIKGIDKECMDAGMNDYISKPFNQSELFNKILNLINYGTKAL